METAKNASATGLQKMFMNRDTDDGTETDFVIETGDGDEIKFHSWVLRLRQSDFFDTLLSSDFKERREGKVTLAASTETVTQFVKFLYAFELDESMSLSTWKELIQISGVYDSSVQDGAAEILKQQQSWPGWMSALSTIGVFDLLAFCKEHKATKAVNVCESFIAKNFDSDFLLEAGHLEANPEIAVEILRQIKLEKEQPEVQYLSSDEATDDRRSRKRRRKYHQYDRSPSPSPPSTYRDFNSDYFGSP